MLADAREAGASRWVLGGDYALFGAWPAETVARLRELEPATWIRGNVDRWAGDPAAAPDDSGLQAAIADTRAALGDPLADELGRLPAEAEVAGARFVHASPVSDLRAFAPEPADDEEELLDGTTHAAARVRPHPRPVPPPGGGRRRRDRQPRLGRHAARRRPARRLRADRPDTRELELRRVEYDTAATIAQLRETYGEREWAPTILRRLETQRA